MPTSGTGCRRIAVVLATVIAAGVVFSGCTGSGSDRVAGDPSAGCVPVTPERLVATVISTSPHDPDAYTQGLLVIDDTLYESTGLEGESTVREVDPATGEVLASSPLPPDVFGEGLTARGGDQLVQLTWKDEVAYVWDRATLSRADTFTYEGEGWGLTTLDDGRFVMSDGSDSLTIRDPDDFSISSQLRVSRVDGAADRLNELEWDGTTLWANRYRTAELVGIHVDCGTVGSVVDLSALWDDARARAADSGIEIDVPNGVAHIPDTDRYLVTGKLWPVMYEVRFDPA